MRSIDEAPEELQVAVREFWLPEEWDHAVSISFLESKWNAFAENDTRTADAACGDFLPGRRGGVRISAEWSIGWFQINACNYPDWNPCHFFNTRHNVGTAHDLWSRRGWQPWFFSAQSLGLPV